MIRRSEKTHGCKCAVPSDLQVDGSQPAPDFDPAIRNELVRLWNAFDGGDRSALDAIEQICLTQDNDAALAAFACRIREAGPGGAFKLKEK